ncbi:uncharacterized protein K452DRAFT_197201, partial [Aplosporella prunicola CBS 121167]
LSLIILTPLLLLLLHDLKTWYLLPRGPTPLPFIGNKHQLSPTRPWAQLAAWARRYGPIYTIWTGRHPTLVINDPVLASDLLERRSATFSSRPRMVAMGELLWANASILVQPYGPAWALRRKLLHRALAPPALESYKPVQEAEAARLCRALLDVESPRGFERPLERFTASVVFAAAYGRRIDSLEAKVLRDRFAFMRYASGLNVPGKYAVEAFPWLKYVPAFLAPWKADIQAHGAAEAAANLALLGAVEADLRAYGADAVAPCLAKQLLLAHAESPIPLSRRDIAFLPASLFGAGSDTTASTLCSALLALVTHPAAQRTLHTELAATVPLSDTSGRLPRFADLPRLPYLRAAVHETLRWRPVAALGGTPHAASAGEWVGAWYVPRGTTVLVNSWGVNLNEAYYPDAHVFRPERFLAETKAREGEEKLGRPHPTTLRSGGASAGHGHSSFGWGRRVCPGAGLALNSLAIALACLVWGFEVLPAEGREGRVALEGEGPEKGYDIFDYTEGFNIRPRELECRLRVRSVRHREVIEREMGRAMEVL